MFDQKIIISYINKNEKLKKKLIVDKNNNAATLPQFNKNSFSEGVASINDFVNSNDITHLSSMEEYDKCSHLTDSSLIRCDGYKYKTTFYSSNLRQI